MTDKKPRNDVTDKKPKTSPPADDLEAAFAEPDAAAESVLSAKNRLLRRTLAQQVERNVYLETQVDLLTAIDSIGAKKPSWPTPRRSRRSRTPGIANLVLSDLHLDEVVNPAEIGGVNAYSRAIAERRLRTTFEKFVLIAKEYIAGIDYDGAVVPMLGDTFSGNIHAELKETNEVSILDSIDFWIDHFVAGFQLVADEFGKLHVPCTPGNHGRNTYKPVMKGRARDNFDFLFMRQVARALAGDGRITFEIPDSTDVQMKQYGTTFHYTHGDQFRGGSGISGVFTPLMLGDMRKRKRQAAVGAPYDVLVLGHFHQYLPTPWFIMNGSLKGYDEYASIANFGFEVPKQAFWVTTPEQGVTFSAPILPMDRTAEGW